MVIYNRVKETQRHYRGHTEEITCMDINPSKNLGLSGQRNGKTHDSRLVNSCSQVVRDFERGAKTRCNF